MSQSLDNIIIIPRPAYSSERYYLLSELEQICSFPGTIHDSALLSTSSTSITPPRGLVMLYLLLKLDSNFINNSDFEEIDKVATTHRLFLCLEALDTKGSYSRAPEQVVEMVRALSLRYPNCFVALGVGNKASTTTALDYCLDVVQELEGSIKLFEIISLRSLDMLGHQPDAEPDAVCNIQQYICVTDSHMAWARAHKDVIGFNEAGLKSKYSKDGTSSLSSRKEFQIQSFWDISFVIGAVLLLGLAVIIHHSGALYSVR